MFVDELICDEHPSIIMTVIIIILTKQRNLSGYSPHCNNAPEPYQMTTRSVQNKKVSNLFPAKDVLP
jgi:hypothetical protein